MSDLEGTLGNDDCNLVNQLWKFLDNPASGEWYLGNIIKNGLKVSALGIDIAPFPTIAVGDIPQQTMFDWALEYMGISMSDTQLRGLDTFSGGTLSCTPTSATETSVNLTLNFGALVYVGNYDVGTSGVSGCAIATASKLTGGHVSAEDLALVPSVESAGSTDQQLDNARWFRDDQTRGLPSSDNGRTLIGGYYLQQDTINKVTAANTTQSNLYRQTLGKQQAVADAVDTSTAYYKNQTGTKPPAIGETDQYAGGFQSAFYLSMATQALASAEGIDFEAEIEAESDNEYVQLANAMGHFKAQVQAFQRDKPGPQQTSDIMAYIPTVNAQASVGLAVQGEDFADTVGIPIFDLENGAIVKHLPLFELDEERAKLAHASMCEATLTEQDKGWFHVKGAFADTAQTVAITCETTFTNTGKSLSATVNKLAINIGDLNIVLGNKAGFSSQPTLYNKIAGWIANSGSFQDTLKSKLSSAANSASVRHSVQEALNGGLKKLGL